MLGGPEGAAAGEGVTGGLVAVAAAAVVGDAAAAVVGAVVAALVGDDATVGDDGGRVAAGEGVNAARVGDGATSGVVGAGDIRSQPEARSAVPMMRATMANPAIFLKDILQTSCCSYNLRIRRQVAQVATSVKEAGNFELCHEYRSLPLFQAILSGNT